LATYIRIQGDASVDIVYGSDDLMIYEINTVPDDRTGRLVALDWPRQKVVWQRPIRRVFAAHACRERDLLVAICDDKAHALSMSSGKDIWQVDLTKIPGASSLSRRRSLAADDDGAFQFTRYRVPLVTGSYAIVTRKRVEDLAGTGWPVWEDWLALSMDDGTVSDQGPHGYAGHTQTHVMLRAEAAVGQVEREWAFATVLVGRTTGPVDWWPSKTASNMSPYTAGAYGLSERALEGGRELLVYRSDAERPVVLPAGRWPRYRLDWAVTKEYLIEFTQTARDEKALPLHATVFDLDGNKLASRRLSEITPHADRWLTWLGTDGDFRGVFRTSRCLSRKDISRVLVYTLPGLSFVSSWALSPKPTDTDLALEEAVVLGNSGTMCEVLGIRMWRALPADTVPHRVVFNFRAITGGRITWSYVENVDVMKFPEDGE
jgi:hypothetical protein